MDWTEAMRERHSVRAYTDKPVEGETLVLTAQTLGLNTCWVGLTFR